MKLLPSLVASGLLLSSTDALNLLETPQQVLGWANNAFGRTPATASLKKLADQVGIDSMWLPNSIRKIWTEADEYIPKSIEEAEEKANKFFPRLSSHLFDPKGLKSTKKRKQRTDWDITVKTEKFPNHSLRAKSTPSDLGIDKVKQYSGYFDVNKEDEDGRHLFFWFFESRNDPKNDPIILWLNGGPGCSSLMGLFYEHGPAVILTEEKEPLFNPHSWNNNASVIYLDQPSGVGFSYSDSGYAEIADTRAASVDTYAFLSLFFKQFPEYKNLGLHIAGESYAGHYIPSIATEILSHPERDFEFSSILIGNGWTDVYNQVPSYEPMACGKGGYPSILDESQCLRVNKSASRCQTVDGQCYKHQDRFRCIPASYVCDSVTDPFMETGLNPYDIRKKCIGKLCYGDIDLYADYLNRKDIQAAIGAEIEDYASCSDSVFNAFAYSGDSGKPFQFDVAQALQQGLPVLVYAGDKDYICNWLSQILWLDALEWSGSEEWKNNKVEEWKTPDSSEVSGTYKSAGNLTFLRVIDAGHMVPYDKPEAASDMITRWLHKDRSFA